MALRRVDFVVAVLFGGLLACILHTIAVIRYKAAFESAASLCSKGNDENDETVGTAGTDEEGEVPTTTVQKRPSMQSLSIIYATLVAILLALLYLDVLGCQRIVDWLVPRVGWPISSFVSAGPMQSGIDGAVAASVSGGLLRRATQSGGGGNEVLSMEKKCIIPKSMFDQALALCLDHPAGEIDVCE